MNAWSNLPNAHHIDWVIQSVKTHPVAWSANCLLAAEYSAWEVARNVAYDATYHAIWYAAWVAARDAAHEAGRVAGWVACRVAIRNTILALVVYDDCDQYLNMTSEELKVWALLSERPAAVLLLPMVIARERINELETV